MANVYKNSKGSYFIKRSAKAYDADNSKNKEEKGQRQEMEERVNISRGARKALSESEQAELAKQSGIKGVSTGGGDPLPKGSKDNQFLVAEDAEEAEEMREMTNGNIPVRVQQERNEDGTFAGTPQENDKKTGKKIRNDPDKVTHTAVQDKDIFEMLGLSPEEIEKRLERIKYTYEEFKSEMLSTYGQIKDRMPSEEQLKINKKLAVLRKIRQAEAERKAKNLARRKEREKAAAQAAKDKQKAEAEAKKYEEKVKSERYDYEGKTQKPREFYVRNARKLSDQVNASLKDLINQGVDMKEVYAMLNAGETTKGYQTIYGPQGLARFRRWSDDREKAANAAKEAQQSTVNKPKPEEAPAKPQKTKAEEAYERYRRSEEDKIVANLEKNTNDAKEILNKLKGSKEYGDRALDFENKLNAAIEKGDPTSVIFDIKELGREINKKRQAEANEEKEVMSWFNGGNK